MKNHNKKRALFSSIISLILCVTMLLGTTFAWFTSSVSNTGNRIRTGELGVALWKYNAETGKYTDISGGEEGDIFTDSGENGTLWEPNRTEIVFLEVRNTKSLALNYNLILDVTADTANKVKLEDVLSYAILPGVKGEDFDKNQFKTWEDVLQWKNVDIETGVVPVGQTTAAPNGALEAGESDFFALAVHMDENAGNEYQNCGITIDVNVMARQMASEYDSFGNQYDADSLFTEQGEPLLEDALSGIGDMETANQSIWAYRNANNNEHGVFQFLNDEESRDGSYYLKLAPADSCQKTGCTSNKTGHLEAVQQSNVQMNYKKVTGSLEPGKTYYLKFWIKQADNTKATRIQLSNVYTGGDSTNYMLDVNTKSSGDWEEVTEVFTIDADAVKSNFRLIVWGYDGEVCIDDFRICTADVSDALTGKMAFQQKLAAEEAESMMPVSTDPEPTVYLPPVDGIDNYLVNGTFNTGSDSWAPNAKSVDMYSWVADSNGGGYLKIENTKAGDTDLWGNQPAIGQNVTGIIPMAEYQISFDYKIDPDNTQTLPFVELECFTNEVYPGYEGHLEGVSLSFNASDIIKDGEWHTISYRTRMPLRTDWVQVFLRHTKNYSLQAGKTPVSGAVYYDNVTFTMTNTADALEVNSDMLFYYSDMDTAEVVASVNKFYEESYGNGKIVFEVFDGQNFVCQSEEIAPDGSLEAKWNLDLGLLQKIDTPYCIRATLYVDGAKKATAGTNIYLYDRPAAINENGEYAKFGEDFVPVIGYHVTGLEDKQKLEEGGINVVQMNLNEALDIDLLLATLDELEEVGLKGMITMYHKVGDTARPAGHEGNMENTIAVVSNEEVRNHPALFGYNIVDEPWNDSNDPTKELENSYRLIRQYDKDNVIMFVENSASRFATSSLYADALIVDIYEPAAGAAVYEETLERMEALSSKKPVFALLETYITANGRFVTPDDVRNNNYQALLAGAEGYGYFSISDAGNVEYASLLKLGSEWADHVWDKKTEGGPIAVWEVTTPTNATAGQKLWEGLKGFAADEQVLASAHFVHNEGTKLVENINIADGYMYYSWAAEDGKIYLVVLDVKGNDVTVDIPLKAADGSDMGSYTAKFIAGRTGAADITGSGSMNITLTGVEALLFEITAN